MHSFRRVLCACLLLLLPLSAVGVRGAAAAVGSCGIADNCALQVTDAISGSRAPWVVSDSNAIAYNDGPVGCPVNTTCAPLRSGFTSMGSGAEQSITADVAGRMVLQGSHAGGSGSITLQDRSAGTSTSLALASSSDPVAFDSTGSSACAVAGDTLVLQIFPESNTLLHTLSDFAISLDHVRIVQDVSCTATATDTLTATAVPSTPTVAATATTVPTATAISTPTPVPAGVRDCGVNIVFTDCNAVLPAWTHYGILGGADYRRAETFTLGNGDSQESGVFKSVLFPASGTICVHSANEPESTSDLFDFSQNVTQRSGGYDPINPATDHYRCVGGNAGDEFRVAFDNGYTVGGYEVVQLGSVTFTPDAAGAATLTAVAGPAASATEAARLTATAAPAATLTVLAGGTATQVAYATQVAASTATAMAQATATYAPLATAVASATAAAAASATAAPGATVAAQATATQAAAATATAAVQATATAAVQATATAQASATIGASWTATDTPTPMTTPLPTGTPLDGLCWECTPTGLSSPSATPLSLASASATLTPWAYSSSSPTPTGSGTPGPSSAPCGVDCQCIHAAAALIAASIDNLTAATDGLSHPTAAGNPLTGALEYLFVPHDAPGDLQPAVAKVKTELPAIGGALPGIASIPGPSCVPIDWVVPGFFGKAGFTYRLDLCNYGIHTVVRMVLLLCLIVYTTYALVDLVRRAFTDAN